MTEHFDPDRAKEWADTYGDLGAVAPARSAQLPLNILDPWVAPDGQPQPFKPYSMEKLMELAENIKKNGVIEAICVRPTQDGRFQILAGHNRVEAAKLAGLNTVPATIRQLSDEDATILMVDSNLQHREKLVYSELAFSYKYRLEAMSKSGKRHPGRPQKENSSQLATNYSKGRTDADLAELIGISKDQVRRYIRLTELITPLLDMVDNGKFAFLAAVEISYLSKDAQALLLAIMNTEPCKAPSLKQAKQLRAIYDAGELDEDAILAVMVKPQGAQKTEIKLSLPTHRFGRFFGPHTTQAEILTTIEAALEMYAKQQEGKNLTPAST